MLQARDVTFAYDARGANAVLRGVSCEFPAGEVTGVLGPNGAGKSTLLRVLLGVLRPQAGAATLGGVDVRSVARRERARRVAYIPQRSDVAFPFSVAQVVGMGRYSAQTRGAGADGPASSASPVSSALRAVGLAERGADTFGVLSAGQQQRVTLARALAQLGAAGAAGEAEKSSTEANSAGPASLAGRALLADEPMSAMDPRAGLEAEALLADLARRGAAVVVVLHDLGAALRLCTRAVLLDAGGRVAAQGRVDEVLAPEPLQRVFGTPFEPLRDGAGRVAGLSPRV